MGLVKLLLEIIKDCRGVSLSITRCTANTLITASGFNGRFDEIEAVVNALTADNLAADSVTAVKINSDVVRADYGLRQHTDGSLYVDLSDTTPGLELTDGGLRVKSYGLAQRTANGLEIGRAGDLLLSSAASVPDGWTDVSATYEGKFIRISATALSSGGSDTHSHTLAEANLPAHVHALSSFKMALTSTSSGFADNVGGGYTTQSGGNTSSTGSTTAFTGDNVPAYVSVKMMQKS